MFLLEKKKTNPALACKFQHPSVENPALWTVGVGVSVPLTPYTFVTWDSSAFMLLFI